MWCSHVYIVSYNVLFKNNFFFNNPPQLYYRLIGCPPFWHRKQMIMLRNIMEGKYSFNSPEWQDISGKNK